LGKIVALDFDGVICNSLNECLIVSYCAFNENLNLSYDSSKIRPTHQKQFNKYRYLVGPAHQFYYLWDMILSNEGNIIESFNRLDYNEAMEKKFAKKFYAIRKKMINNNFDEWLLLNPFYSNVLLFIKENFDFDKFFIVTSKDLFSVVKLLEFNKIKLDKDHIFSRELSFSKVRLFEILKSNFNIMFEDIIFIDDKISHLLEVQPLGIDCYLSTWGYIGHDSIKIAKENKISPLHISDLNTTYLSC
tara:strand:+ start:7849 stop:8586 length:738 start_codon:yes stop_codon:yes gene_type:complete